MKTVTSSKKCRKTCQWSLPVQIRTNCNDYRCDSYLSEWEGYIVNQSHACPKYASRDCYIQ